MTDTHRKAVALLALIGGFVSLYLLLYKLGVYGTLQCGPGGSCEFVQASEYAYFLGVPVAGWGLVWYVAVLLTALAGLRPMSGMTPDRLLALLAGAGLAFTVYLTVIELFVLGAICRWCVGSAVLVVLIFAAAWPAIAGVWRREGPTREPAPGHAATDAP